MSQDTEASDSLTEVHVEEIVGEEETTSRGVERDGRAEEAEVGAQDGAEDATEVEEAPLFAEERSGGEACKDGSGA